MHRIYIDTSTATGIQKRITQRICELKAEYSEDKIAFAVVELQALHAEIDIGLNNLIEDMFKADQARRQEQQIMLDDAGLSWDDLKAQEF